METGNLVDLVDLSNNGTPPPPPPVVEPTTVNSGSQEVLSKAAEQMKQLSIDTAALGGITNNGTSEPEVKAPLAAPAPVKDSQPKPSPRTTNNSAKVAATTPTDKKPKTPSTVSQTKSRPSKQTNGDSPAKTGVNANSAATTRKPASPATTPTAATARTRPAASPTTNPVASARAAASASARRSSAPPPSQNSPANAGSGDASSGEVKKLPMNKIKVGNTPSPNVKEVKSKIGSLASATHKAGGGNVKISQSKLNWKAESKIGSLSNVGYQPASSNVKVNRVNPTAVETKKIELKGVSSKIGSLQNVKHKPGGGEKKIFDDKEYLKQVSPSSKTPSEKGGSSIPHSPTPREDARISGSNVAASGGP